MPELKFKYDDTLGMVIKLINFKELNTRRNSRLYVSINACYNFCGGYMYVSVLIDIASKNLIKYMTIKCLHISKILI